MRIIKLFEKITKIPRCSKTHKPMIEFLQNFAKTNNFLFDIDKANNILIKKPNSQAKICLQSHYDIVCLEDNKIPTIINKDGFLSAKDSTLGADNGIGCAYMLALIEDNIDGEYLFTCDEEIGLIGANNITLKLNSTYMLNLDSEEEGFIYIGCAGGVDICASSSKNKIIPNSEKKDLYEITLNNLDGGHSGIDIDKNIPNAIKLIAQTIKQCDGELLDIDAGERSNSIPKNAKAIIVSKTIPLPTHKNMKIKKVNTTTNHYKSLDENIIKFLYSFANGVRSYDTNLNIVLNSINLSTIKTTIDKVNIIISARSMQNLQLQILEDETIALLKYFGFETKTIDKSLAWNPVENDFAKKVFAIYEKYNKDISFKAIHAGLECGIFQDKYPNMQVCSIGPNIFSPHSNKEKCEIQSVNNLFEIIVDIMKNLR
jgi:dipeptidase D